MSFATLGDDITFEVSSDKVYTWIEARRAGEARWATLDVYAGKPVKEFLGPGLDTITFPIRYDADRGVVPRDELRKLRKLRDTGAVLQFVVGGQLVGDFVLKGLAEDWRRFSRNGVLVTAIVDVTLEEYQ